MTSLLRPGENGALIRGLRLRNAKCLRHEKAGAGASLSAMTRTQIRAHRQARRTRLCRIVPLGALCLVNSLQLNLTECMSPETSRDGAVSMGVYRVT